MALHLEWLTEFCHTILSTQTIQGALPTLFTHPQHKHTFIILYQGSISLLNFCLNADAILHHSEQVDEDLTHPCHSLKSKGLSSSSSQYPKVDLTTFTKFVCCWLLCDLCRDLPFRFWYLSYDPLSRLIQTFLPNISLSLPHLSCEVYHCSTIPHSLLNRRHNILS